MSGIFKFKGNICVQFNRRKCLTKLCLLPEFFQILACSWRFQLINMLVCIFNRLVLLNDLCRCLFANSRNTRNIISSITHQSLYINKFLRCYSIAFLHICRIIIFYFRLSLLRLWDADLNMLCRKLKRITVSGNDGNIHSFLLTTMRQGSQKIIRLKSGLFNHFYMHRTQNVLDHRHLLTQFLCHRLSRALIICKHLMAKCRRMHIKCNRQIFRLLFI